MSMKTAVTMALVLLSVAFGTIVSFEAISLRESNVGAQSSTIENIGTLEVTTSSSLCPGLQDNMIALNKTIAAIQQNATFVLLEKGMGYNYSSDEVSYIHYDNGTNVCENAILQFTPEIPNCGPTIVAMVTAGGSIVAVYSASALSNHGYTQSYSTNSTSGC